MMIAAAKYTKRIRRAACGLLLISLVAGTATAYAEEENSYYEADGLLIVEEDAADANGEAPAEEEDPAAAGEDGITEPITVLTGTFTVPEGWSRDDSASTEETSVYRADDAAGLGETSTISCSYLDTNYSVLEYEQLRDMLTNSLRYSNVDAQISTSAVYTLSKDYLYIVLVDDSAVSYRDIYHYVVGNYRCFCVQVREYREEAQQDEDLEKQTPQQAGQAMAESFSWIAD